MHTNLETNHYSGQLSNYDDNTEQLDHDYYHLFYSKTYDKIEILQEIDNLCENWFVYEEDEKYVI